MDTAAWHAHALVRVAWSVSLLVLVSMGRVLLCFSRKPKSGPHTHPDASQEGGATRCGLYLKTSSTQSVVLCRAVSCDVGQARECWHDMRQARKKTSLSNSTSRSTSRPVRDFKSALPLVSILGDTSRVLPPGAGENRFVSSSAIASISCGFVAVCCKKDRRLASR